MTGYRYKPPTGSLEGWGLCQTRVRCGDRPWGHPESRHRPTARELLPEEAATSAPGGGSPPPSSDQLQRVQLTQDRHCKSWDPELGRKPRGPQRSRGWQSRPRQWAQVCTLQMPFHSWERGQLTFSGWWCFNGHAKIPHSMGYAQGVPRLHGNEGPRVADLAVAELSSPTHVKTLGRGQGESSCAASPPASVYQLRTLSIPAFLFSGSCWLGWDDVV